MLLGLTVASVLTYLDAAKFWVGVAGVLGFGYKFVSWFRDIRVKDLKDIQDGVKISQAEIVKQTDVLKEIHEGTLANHQELIRQTDLFQRGFDNIIMTQKEGTRDLRDDFKTFFAFARPMMAPVGGAPEYKRKDKAKVRKKAVCCKK
jgi:hypothetical protein